MTESHQPSAVGAALLRDHGDAITSDWIERVGELVASRSVERGELANSVREFLGEVADQLARGEREAVPTASEHGAQRYRAGFHLASMCREYGLLLDSIERVAGRERVALEIPDYVAIVRLVMRGMADATTTYVERERTARQEMAHRHFGFIAHELRNPIQTLELGLAACEGLMPGNVEAIMRRNLTELRERVDSTLVAVSDTPGASVSPRCERFDLVQLVEDIVETSRVHANARGVRMTVQAPDAPVEVELDRRLVVSALHNLVRNAVKFTCDASEVIVRLRSSESDVHLEIEDRCGGLPEGVAEQMFSAFSQHGEDRTGFGLGLAIARQAVEAHRGQIQVHDVEGRVGCVMVVNLPRSFEPMP